MFASVMDTLLTSCLHLFYKKRFSENWGKFPGKYLQWTLLLIFKFAEQLQKQPPKVFFEESLIRNFAKFEGKHLCESLFFNKVVGLSPATLLKVTLAQVFFYQFCNISKNNFFTEHLWATASEHKYWPGGISLKIEVLNISGNLKRRWQLVPGLFYSEADTGAVL